MLNPPLFGPAPGEADPAAAYTGTPIPGVPPLLPGETAPTRSVNYFEPREMSTTGIGSAFQSCLKMGMQTDVQLPLDRVAPYCACLTDAWRRNTHDATEPAAASPPTAQQRAVCADARVDGGPLDFPLPKDTLNLTRAWQACIDEHPGLDHGVYCGCFLDGKFQDLKVLRIRAGDEERCAFADRVYGATHQRLTLRQFRSLPVTLSPAAASAWFAEKPAGR